MIKTGVINSDCPIKQIVNVLLQNCHWMIRIYICNTTTIKNATLKSKTWDSWLKIGNYISFLYWLLFSLYCFFENLGMWKKIYFLLDFVSRESNSRWKFYHWQCEIPFYSFVCKSTIFPLQTAKESSRSINHICDVI